MKDVPDSPDVFIEAFKRNQTAIETIQRIGFQNIGLSAITLMELYFGALNKRELSKIKSRMLKLKIFSLDDNITGKAINLIEKYSKRHALHIPDALIAATALCYGVDLLTYNVKHFQFVQGIKLYDNRL